MEKTEIINFYPRTYHTLIIQTQKGHTDKELTIITQLFLLAHFCIWHILPNLHTLPFFSLPFVQYNKTTRLGALTLFLWVLKTPYGVIQIWTQWILWQFSRIFVVIVVSLLLLAYPTIIVICVRDSSELPDWQTNHTPKDLGGS